MSARIFVIGRSSEKLSALSPEAMEVMMVMVMVMSMVMLLVDARWPSVKIKRFRVSGAKYMPSLGKERFQSVRPYVPPFFEPTY